MKYCTIYLSIFLCVPFDTWSMEAPIISPSSVLVWSEESFNQFFSHNDQSTFLSWLPFDLITFIIKPCAYAALCDDFIEHYFSPRALLVLRPPREHQFRYMDVNSQSQYTPNVLQAYWDLARMNHPWKLTLSLCNALKAIDYFDSKERLVGRLLLDHKYHLFTEQEHVECETLKKLKETWFLPNSKQTFSRNFSNALFPCHFFVALLYNYHGLIYENCHELDELDKTFLLEFAAAMNLPLSLKKILELWEIANWSQICHHRVLYNAIVWGNSDIVGMLISQGVMINAQDKDGNTVLHRIAHEKWNWKFDPKVIIKGMRQLLFHGADCTILNKDGKKPIELIQNVPMKLAFLEALAERSSRLLFFKGKS